MDTKTRRMTDKAVEELKKLIDGDPAKGLDYHAGTISREFPVNGREIRKMYVDKYGEPKKTPSKQGVKVRNSLLKKFGLRMEEGGAGEWGTDELSDNYKKDTPNEPDGKKPRAEKET